MKRNNIIQTQIRLPEKLHTEVKKEAEELGVSLNAHICELIWMGIKARKSLQIIQKGEAQ